MPVADKLAPGGPRKLLALDGGGVRGVVAIEALAAIERLLQRELGCDDRFVLADYFDYIAGTSTGAIIAAGLALGMRVDRLRDFYVTGAAEMFARARLRDRLRSKYAETRLADRLRREFGADTLLGSDQLRTLLLLIMRNATTDSPWPVCNNPAAKFNRPDLPDSNLKLPLWQLVRASTATPLYFPPETIDLGGRRYVFVDGGTTVFNNPAFQLFLMATVEPYNLSWPTGEDRMLLVSVGTGVGSQANPDLTPAAMTLVYQASAVASGLMSAAMGEQDLLCRVFGKCLVGDALDEEVGDLIGAAGPVAPKLFTYLRYNGGLTREGLDRLGLPHLRPEDVQRLDAVEQVDALREVGAAVAHQVTAAHFAGFLP